MRVIFVNGKMWVDTWTAEDDVAEDASAVGGRYTGS